MSRQHQLGIVYWKDSLRKVSGHGSAIPLVEAERVASLMNREMPWIHHWAIPLIDLEKFLSHVLVPIEVNA
jgi:hypothetical protein